MKWKPDDLEEAERIKAAVSAATNREELDGVRERERAALQALEARQGCKVLGIHIRNLVAYRLTVDRLK